MPPQGADPSLLGGFLNPLEKTDHVEVLPAIRYKVTRLDEPGTYVANAAVSFCPSSCSSAHLLRALQALDDEAFVSASQEGLRECPVV